MQRWKLTIEYDGGPFSGWQRQDSTISSVQQALEDAIAAFCANTVTVHVAGRTDAGVHAHGQVAHADLDFRGRTYAPFEVVKGLNAHLRPHPVCVLAARPVPETFHARFDAVEKLYTYTLLNRGAPPALDRSRVWHVFTLLDIPAMKRAAGFLLGRHDFSTFRDADCQAKSPIRTLDALDIETAPYDPEGGTVIRIHARARSFLHHQVRNMIGSLRLVGEGKWTPEDLRAALEAKDRTRGGQTAPAQGLCLMRVMYPEEA